MLDTLMRAASIKSENLRGRTGNDVAIKGLLPCKVRAGRDRCFPSSLDSLLGQKTVLEVREHVLIL